jgi:hypothetical protein
MKRIGEIWQDAVDGFYEGILKTWPLGIFILAAVAVYALAILATAAQPTREKGTSTRLECTCREIPPSNQDPQSLQAPHRADP